jgi:hypothetical protein
MAKPPRNPDRVGWLQLMCRRAVAYAKEPMTTKEIATRSLTRVAVLERKHAFISSITRASKMKLANAMKAFASTLTDHLLKHDNRVILERRSSWPLMM